MMKKIAILFVTMMLLLLPTMAMAGELTIEGFTAVGTDKVLNAGESFSMTMTVKNATGIEDVQVAFLNMPNSDSNTTYTYYNQSGSLEIQYTVPRNVREGSYTLYRIVIETPNGVAEFKPQNGDMPALTINCKNTICNDFVKPELSNVRLQQQGKTLYYGDTITLQLNAHDESAIESGFVKYARMTSSGDYTAFIEFDNFRYNAETGVVTMQGIIPTGTQPGKYVLFACGVQDEWGNSSQYHSDDIFLTISDRTPLRITTQPKAATVRKSTSAKFTVKAEGDGLTYQWQYREPGTSKWKNFTTTGNKRATFSLKTKMTHDGYKVRCVIKDEYGDSVNTRAVSLKVKDVPALKITTQPVKATVLKGKYATFTVKANGSGIDYQWQYRTSNNSEWKNFTAASATTKTFKLKTKTDHNGYQIRCVLTDEFGDTAETKAVKLTVKSIIINKQPANATVKKGQNATFKVDASGAKLTYQWQYRATANGNWKNFTAASAKTASFKLKAKANQNGYKVRCLITASDGKTAYSKVVTLKVK